MIKVFSLNPSLGYQERFFCAEKIYEIDQFPPFIISVNKTGMFLLKFLIKKAMFIFFCNIQLGDFIYYKVSGWGIMMIMGN